VKKSQPLPPWTKVRKPSKPLALQGSLKKLLVAQQMLQQPLVTSQLQLGLSL
jgi:hypothetical protein